MPTPETAARPPREYAVFISYRHADNKDPGRQWASWLHHSLETYEVPPDLVGTPNSHGEPIPASLYPIFRDEEELPAGADLTAEIRQALERSRTLVVLCSPRADGSRFVADEIRYFKELGKSAHLLALMIDGEPNATDDPGKHAAGIPASAECLPEPLRFGVPRDDGTVDWAARAEPVCADVRPEGRPVQGWTTAAACRESLEREGARAPDTIAARVQDYERRLEIAKLKIVAGALGVPLGLLTQRDQEYRRREAERRAAEERVRREEAERLQALAEQREKEATEANERRRQLLREISRSDVATAEAALVDGNWPNGIAYLGRALISDPENSSAMAWLWSELILGKIQPIPELILACPDSVSSATFSADGQRILTVSSYSWRYTAQTWEAATGQPLGETLRQESGWLSFSADGRRVVSVTKNVAQTWEAATGRRLGEALLNMWSEDRPCPPVQNVWYANKDRWSDKAEELTRMSTAHFSADGQRILTVTHNTAQVWEVATARSLGAEMQHEEFMRQACFSPDDRRVLTMSGEATVRVWDALTGRAVGEPIRHEKRVRAANFSPNSLRVVTAGEDKTARMWDASTGLAVGVAMQHEGTVTDAKFGPEGLRVVTVSEDKTARLWEAETGCPLGVPMRHPAEVRTVSFSPNALHIVTGAGSAAWVWNTWPQHVFGGEIRHQDVVRRARFSPDGRRVVTASYDKTARVWDAETGRPVSEPMPHQDAVFSASFSPDGLRILTASRDCTARLWDAASGRAEGKPMEHRDQVRSASFSPDGQRIITASNDQTAQVWDAATGTPLGYAMEHGDVVVSACFSLDGLRILTAGLDKSVYVWEVATGRPMARWHDFASEVRSAAFSPDGLRVIVTNGSDAQVLDVSTGLVLGDTMQHEFCKPINTAKFSPDGLRVVTASFDCTARVWDVATGHPVGEIMRHAGSVKSARFSPDGQRILTVSSDRTARIWDAMTGRMLGAAMRHEGEVLNANFSPDGDRIVTASWDKTARVWPVGSPQRSEDWMPDFVAAASGLRFNADGVLAEVPMPERLELREKLRALRPGEPGSPVRDRDWARLLRWWLTPPAQRPSLF